MPEESCSSQQEFEFNNHEEDLENICAVSFAVGTECWVSLLSCTLEELNAVDNVVFMNKSMCVCLFMAVGKYTCSPFLQHFFECNTIFICR